ncbi:MAG: hypothetical protein AAGF92_14610 [Myxococcota bacterium]
MHVRLSQLPQETQKVLLAKLCSTVARQLYKKIRADERAQRQAEWEPYAKGQSNTPKRRPKAKRPQCQAITTKNTRCQARCVWVRGRSKPRRYCHLHTPRSAHDNRT